MREKLVEFLKPDKRKIIITLILPSSWMIVRLFSSNILGFEGAVMIKLPLTTHVINYLFESLIFYPFACSLAVLFEYYKKREMKYLKKDKGMLALVSLGILIFNPVVIPILALSPYLLSYWMKAPHGLYVMDIIPDSPATGRGEWMQGRTIIALDNAEITEVGDAIEILDKSRSGDWLKITTSDGSSGSVRLGSHPKETRAYIGIKVRDKNRAEAIL